ncbi:MAG TPA: nuclear transport factor 2 family protein [Propylenella sp.]
MRCLKSIRVLACVAAALFAVEAVAQTVGLESRVASFYGGISDAWESGDADRLAALFTEDAKYWTPLGDTLDGRAAIREWLATLGPTEKLSIEPLHVETVGDKIFGVGNFTQDITVEGRDLHYEGGYAALVVEAGNELRFHRLISFPARKPLAEAE